MILFESLLYAAQNRNRILLVGRIDRNRLEAALKCGVRLHIFTVLVERSRPDAVQFAARKHWLKHIAGIRRSFGLTGSNDSMDFIDKENYLAVRLFNLFKNRFKTLLELTAIHRTCHQRRHIERKDNTIFKSVRNIAAVDALGKALYDSGFSNTWLTD